MQPDVLMNSLLLKVKEVKTQPQTYLQLTLFKGKTLKNLIICV